MISFYEKDKSENLQYILTLQIISALSKLFSDNNAPFLHYRVMENLFCECFNALNLSRSDIAYDAKIGNLGIGLKTFLLQGNASVEKIAEFNKLSSEFKNLSDEELVLKLCDLRNKRIELANSLHGINQALYHIIARCENKLLFFETDYNVIDISKINNIRSTKASVSFNDEKNEYFFNRSKSVLQRKFYLPKNFNQIDIKIVENPFDIIRNLKDEILNKNEYEFNKPGIDFVILPLYSIRNNEKYIPCKSGLNQFNAGGRKRSADEIYIKIPSEIHFLAPGFFPNRDSYFNLITPINEILRSKVCQDNNKALMSNPNSALSNWLLRKILKLNQYELATYDRLQKLGFDSVIITKINNLEYKIDIMPIDSYEKFINDLKG